MRLRDLSADLPPLGELDEDAVDDISAWFGTTVLLCDTNARAGLVAARFAEYGLAVELAAAATDPALAAWVGRSSARTDRRRSPSTSSRSWPTAPVSRTPMACGASS